MANKKQKVVDEEFDLVEELDAVDCPGGEYFVLAGGYRPGGVLDSAPATYLISRCSSEAFGIAYDAEGRSVSLPKPRPKSEDREARRALARIRAVLREARERGTEFICCYHVKGDAGWYMEWSDDHDLYSAAEDILRFLWSGYFLN